MRKEEKLDMDALLREVAQQQNAALKLDDWKSELLKKAEEGAQAQEPADELWARRRARMRRTTAGFAVAAAALLLFLSARSLLPRVSGKSEAAPQAPYAAQARDDAAPEDIAPFAAMPAPAILGDSADVNEAPAEAAPSAEAVPPAGAPETGTGSEYSASSDYGLRSLDAQGEAAIAAVRAALLEQGLKTRAEAAYAQAVLEENAVYDITTWAGEPARIQSERLYVVSMGVDEASAARYAVNADTLEVYGEIVTLP